MKKLLTLIAMALLLPIGTYAATYIKGKQVATIDRMYQFVKSKNPGFDREIAVQMYKMGEKYGIRGDIALCQSCIETGWFKYTGGTAVTPDDHNYCGLGVTQKGKKGCQFATVALGCEAQIQHLFAYACKDALPYPKVDPRFNYVNRGCAPTWESLGGKWASATNYGTQILAVYNQMMAFNVANPTLKASKTSLSFTVEKGKVSSAQSVTITGSNLSSKIVYNAASKMASVTTSGWDDYTGGTMSIKADASGRAAGSYETYVAVQSGSGSNLKRVEIKVYITVTEPAAAPSLSATPGSLTLSATRGQSNPTATISVKAASLTSDISYNSSTSTFTVAPASGWNARTGGNLIVTMDASKSAGNYSGYVAISGGGASRVQVNISGTITEPAANPTLNVSPSTLTLSCTQGDANPTATVTVSASNLTSGLIYDINGNGFTVTPQSGWNGSTGGRLTVALDASKAAGTYNATLTVKGGGVTTRNVTITGTIKDKGTTPDPTPSTEPNPEKPASLPTMFSTDWEYSSAQGTSTSYMNPSNVNTRNMVLNGDNLYVLQRSSDDANIHIVNAETGVQKGTLDNGSIAADTYRYFSVANLSGTIVACNAALNAASTLKVYAWNGDNATPATILSTTNHGGRAGDLMCASGTINNGKLYFASNTGYAGKVYVYTVTNGTANATPQVITLKDASGKDFDLGGGFAVIEIRVDEQGRILASGKGGATALFRADGTHIESMKNTAVGDNTYGSSCQMFAFGDYTLAASVTYATGVKGGRLNLIDATNGLSNASLIHEYPALSSATGASNSTFVSTAIARVNGAKINLWVLVPGQGIAKYTAAATSGSTSVNDFANAADRMTIALEGRTIRVLGVEKANIAVYTPTGALVASANADTVDAGSLAPGIYVATAVSADGQRAAARVLVR